MIGNTMYSKMRKQFADTFMGRTSVGSYCYSIDGATWQGVHPTRAQLATECVASEAVMNSNGNHGYMARTQVNFNGSTSKTAGDGANVYLMADASTLATLSGSSSNATRLAGVIAFDTSKVITANTSSVNLGFQLTSQGQVQFSTSSSSSGECDATDRAAADSTSTTACIKAMRNYGVGTAYCSIAANLACSLVLKPAFKRLNFLNCFCDEDAELWDLIQSVCLLTAVICVSMSVLIASESLPIQLTFKSGEKKSFNNSTNSNDSGVSTNSKMVPTKFLKDLITQKPKLLKI